MEYLKYEKNFEKELGKEIKTSGEKSRVERIKKGKSMVYSLCLHLLCVGTYKGQKGKGLYTGEGYSDESLYG